MRVAYPVGVEKTADSVEKESFGWRHHSLESEGESTPSEGLVLCLAIIVTKSSMGFAVAIGQT
jgi:hypothetical protein